MIRLTISKELIQKRDNPPYIISRSIFNSLSPLDQLAARALEKCGKIVIVDTGNQDSWRSVSDDNR